MEVVHARCAGLDVHQPQVAACVRIVEGGQVRREVRSFETTTTGLLALGEWLSAEGCTHVALESTGVYGKPVWHGLEASCELVRATAAHLRTVPGRTSDVSDARWIADRRAHGLIRGRVVPPTPIQALRDLTRTRTPRMRESAWHTRRLQKPLEDATLKITGVISDRLGASGRAILEALIAGETDPERLVARPSGRLKAPRRQLIEARRGRIRDHHRFLLRLHLAQIEARHVAAHQVEERIEARLRPFRERAELLTTIPGVSATAAHTILGEIGIDMGRVPSAAHLVSWAGWCPRSDESAGKHRSTRIRKGAPWLKTVLVQAAWAASRKKGSDLRAQFQRLRARRGPMKAIIAVAASMLTAAYHILQTDQPYQDLTDAYLDARDRLRLTRRLIRRLNNLGLEVEVKTAA